MRLAVFALLAAFVPLAAQAPAPRPAPATYRVVLHIVQLDAAGKTTTRDFMLLTETGYRSTLNSGERVPIHDAGGAEAQLTYTPVGLNVQCTVSDSPVADTVGLRLHVEVAAVAVATPFEPTIHQAVADISAQVPLGGNVQVADFGDLDTGARYTVSAEIAPVPPPR